MASIILEIQIEDDIEKCDCDDCKQYFENVKSSARTQEEIDLVNNLSPLQQRFISMMNFIFSGMMISLHDDLCQKISTGDNTPLQLNPLDKQYITVNLIGLEES